MMERPWRIELFGNLRLQQADRVITRFQTYKTGALLAYLAYFRDSPHSREMLADMLWSEASAEAGRRSLRVALNSLRRQLEPPNNLPGTVLITSYSQIQINPVGVITDVSEFESALRAGRGNATENIEDLRKAVDLYHGELLPGYYEDWILLERERLNDAYLNALQSLCGTLSERGELSLALEYGHRAVAAALYQEQNHLTLIRLYVEAGRTDDALHRYTEWERIVREVWDEEPSVEARQLRETLRESATPSDGKRTKPSPPPVAQPETAVIAPPREVALLTPCLPIQFTQFFGRQDEIARLVAFLTEVGVRTARLLTLTGPGGIGKTRLVIEAARRLVERFAGAIWFVSLAEICDPQLIPEAIIDALRIRRSPLMTPLDQAVHALSNQPSLLILDNMEHLLGDNLPYVGPEEGDARVVVQTLLRRVSDLTCLLTSRQPLEVEGELQFPVPPLPIPTEPRARFLPDAAGQVGAHPFPSDMLPWRQSPSVQMFVERAQCVRPDFQLTPRNIDALVTLCARLEGFPLAIELAAAWAQTFTPAQMLSSLDAGRLLVSRRRDRPERHLSLRAAISWSFHLLAPELRRFFTRLSVFVGDWSLEAAAEVCEEEAAEEALSELRARSMIQAEEVGDAMRYRLLETLRQYAADQLSEEEREALARRHALFYLRMAEEAAPALIGSRSQEWMERLRVEQDNLRAVLEWGQTGEIGLRLANALWRFWEFSGQATEGRRRLASALSRAEGADEKVRADALNGAGGLAWLQGDYTEASILFEESLGLSRKVENKRGIASSLNSLGLLAKEKGDYQAAYALFEESLRIFRELGIKGSVAVTLQNLGLVAKNQGDFASARTLMEESLEIYRELGNRNGIATCLHNLGMIVKDQGNHASAQALYVESLEIFRELRDKMGISASLSNLGLVAEDQGAYASALALYVEGLEIARELMARRLITVFLDRFGSLLLKKEDTERAARLWSAASALREAMGFRLPPSNLETQEHEMAAAKAALGTDAFAVALTAGRAMNLEQAIEYALEAATG